MQTAALVLLILAAATTGLGLVPCLGWLNWFAVPLSATTVILAIVGIASDKDPATGLNRNLGLYLAALIIGGLLIGLGSVRCSLGGGLV